MRGVSDLKNYHMRMTTAINELEMLGDYADYTEVFETYGEIVTLLEHRREIVQRRKYGR